MAAALTDEELRKKLKALGVDVGPITPNTRRTYERKLDNILKRHNVNKCVLNALSSDDSEVERSPGDDISRRRKRLNHRIHQISPPKSKPELSPQQDIFKKPLPSPLINKSPGRRHSYSRSLENSTFDMEISDSDYDSDALWKSARTLQTKNHRLSGMSKWNELDSFPKLRKSFQTSTPNGGKSQINSSKFSRTDNYKKTILHNEANSIDSEKKYSKGNIMNGFVTDVVNQEFQNEKHRGKSTNYSYCVSWLLVLAATGLFVILGIFYISTVHNNQLSADKMYLESFKCHPKNSLDSVESQKDCIETEYFETVRLASRELFSLLSTVAGEHECNTSQATRNLTLHETKELLKERMMNQFEESEFEKIFKYSVFLSLNNPEWGIEAFSKFGDKIASFKLDEDIQQISALESKSGAKSWWCRFKHSIHWTLAKLLFIALGITFICLSFATFKFWKKRKEQEEKTFFDLVEKVIDILQSSDENAIPVLHIRDKLFPIQDRKKKYRLWNKVVSFIEENESRVQVGEEIISGEEFKVWRWLPAESEAGKYGKVWQGPAFTNSNKSKNNVQYCPTPCLKVRNMFDSEMEYGDDWQMNIKDAILEKCEGNDGIIHITVDPNSNEGCVYIMCNSTKNAGKAYNSLHGWWFDGKLVTVKYLRLQRYLEKFPESEGCTAPLMPSNNKRLSLSAPFFSSVLERS